MTNPVEKTTWEGAAFGLPSKKKLKSTKKLDIVFAEHLPDVPQTIANRLIHIQQMQNDADQLVKNSSFFTEILPLLLENWRREIHEINYSRYELDNIRFLTEDEFEPVVSAYKEIEEAFEKFHQDLPIDAQNAAYTMYCNHLKTILIAWIEKVKKENVESREKQFKNANDHDKNWIITCIKRLNDQPKEAFQQIEALVNLHGVPTTTRKITNDEKHMLQRLRKLM